MGSRIGDKSAPSPTQARFCLSKYLSLFAGKYGPKCPQPCTYFRRHACLLLSLNLNLNLFLYLDLDLNLFLNRYLHLNPNLNFNLYLNLFMTSFDLKFR